MREWAEAGGYNTDKPDNGQEITMLWDERYSSQTYVYGTRPNDFLVATADQIPKGGRVLCLAEGEGRNAVWLARQGYAVTAVDASAVGLEKAQRLARAHGVAITTVHADLADFVLLPNCWEGIVSIFCHLPMPLRRTLYCQCVAGLCPGAVFLLEAYTPAQLAYKTGGPRDTSLLPDAKALQEDLQGLRFLHLQECVRTIKEGHLHTGQGAVVQVVAQKTQTPHNQP